MLREICRIGHVPVHTIIALGDDKLRASKNRCWKHGLTARKIRSAFGPVMHCVASVATSLHLGGHLKKVQQSTRECMTLLLRSISNCQLDREICVRSLIARDRGYNTRELSHMCLAKGATELGTRKRESNFLFAFGKKARSGQIEVPEKGADAVYRAKLRPDAPGRSNVVLHGFASRRHSRVALLESSTTVNHADASWMLPRCRLDAFRYGWMPLGCP